MRSSEDETMPSSSTWLFPDLMTREELVAVLKHKFKRIGVNIGRVSKLADDELLEGFKRFAMPKPQRKACVSHNFLNRFESIKDSNNSREVSMAKLENSGSVYSRVNPINGRRISAYGKRVSISNKEHHPAEKNARQHSPIRFP
uniref:LEM domain-containing protein n=1 Tax=Elaeophora elaphi TaxID=1147741 RepID=A0A0R3RRU9_9BILA